jgi:CelD/BcsL family acetyltransferase involved in cellulose biosynthesis
LRRAGEFGDVSFSSWQPGAQAVALARKAISLKQRSLLSKSIWSPTVSNPKFGRFFEQLAADPDASLRVSTINCDDKEIGIELSFDCNGHTFGHVLATDPDSPVEGIGSVLVHRAFIAAAVRGTHTFEMMAPADQYKMQHADGETPVSNLAVAFTPKGRLYRDLYLRKMQPVAKVLAQRFAAPLIARMLRNRSTSD